jgi:membrane associated rhomboid family serine protease
LPDAEDKRLPRWPLRLVLSLVVVLEVFLVVMLFVEGAVGNIPMGVNSVGLIVFCVLTWRGIPWSRWLLIAFLASRVAHIGVAMSSYFAPGDQRFGGSMLLVALYVVTGLLVASPLGRSRMRVNGRGHR